MRKLLSAIAIALSLWASPALAQNTTCSDRPAGDSSNACANTRFVSRSASSINTYTPEQYYQSSDGTNWGLAIDRAIQALQVLPNGGTLKLACGTTYTISTVSGNGLSAVRLYDKVNSIGCGDNSVIKIADNVNTSSAFFIYGLFRTGSLNNVLYADFTIDMNGANNSCSQTCWQQNAALGASSGNDITVRHVRMINNPGSNNTLFGSTGSNPPGISNLTLDGLVHEHNGDIVNSASLDWSGDFFVATNVVYANITHSDGPRANGSAFEFHGRGIAASNIVVTDHQNCGIIANETASPVTNDINLGTFKCNNVKAGIQIYSRASATNTNINISGPGTIKFLTGFSGVAVDASSVIDSATGNNINLSVSNIESYSDVTTNLGNDAPGISVGRWKSAKINNNQCYNTQGPCVQFIANAAGASLMAHDNHANFPGHTNNIALQAGVVVSSSAVTTDNISLQGNIITGTIRYGVMNAQNSTSGTIALNTASGATVSQINNTGTGVNDYKFPGAPATIAGVDISQTFTANQRFNDTTFLLSGSTSGTLNIRAAAISGTSIIRFPSGSTDFSATGGTSFVVRQSSIGAPLTVSQLSCSDLTGAGAGCSSGAGITALTGAITASGTGSVVASLGSFSSTNLATALTDETGTGKAVFDTNPTFSNGITVTNNVNAGTFDNISITTPASTATLTLGSGTTFTTTASLTLSGTNGTVQTFPTTNATIARTDAGQTFTGTQVFSSTITGSISGNAATVTTNANLTGPITSVGNATSIASQTGTGTTFVVSNSPTIATPTLSTSFTSPLHIGGTGAASTLTLESTSGAGTTDAIIFLTGSQVERGRITTAGLHNIGPAVTPDSLLTINGNTGSTLALGTGEQVHVIGSDGVSSGLAIDAFGAIARIDARQAEGTLASKTASGTDALFAVFAYGWDTTVYGRGGLFLFQPSATWTTTSHPTDIQFYVTGTGSITNSLVLTLNHNNGISIGSTPAILTASEVGITKTTASGVAPGAGTAKVAWVTGTNAGSCKLISYAGTSTTPVTIVDNVGAGC